MEYGEGGDEGQKKRWKEQPRRLHDSFSENSSITEHLISMLYGAEQLWEKSFLRPRLLGNILITVCACPRKEKVDESPCEFLPHSPR